jgi:hypothetical membrane protein
MSQRRALAGAAGPAAFIATWAVLGANTKGYSPVRDPISRLAAAGTRTQPAMTAGLVALGVGVASYSGELRRALPGPAGTAALVTAVASIGIAATPMDSAIGGTPHVVAAGLTYASLAVTPLLASRALAEKHRGLATVSVAAGLAAATCLAMSVTTKTRTGLWQRLGLTIGHSWVVGSALLIAASSVRRAAPA